jgi:transcriptional regulator with XRE-family HTH domain
MLDYEKFARRLKDTLEDLGMSQAELARRAFISKVTVSRWANAKGVPCADDLYGICEVLGVSADWLLGLSDRKERDT